MYWTSFKRESLEFPSVSYLYKGQNLKVLNLNMDNRTESSFTCSTYNDFHKNFLLVTPSYRFRDLSSNLLDPSPRQKRGTIETVIFHIWQHTKWDLDRGGWSFFRPFRFVSGRGGKDIDLWGCQDRLLCIHLQTFGHLRTLSHWKGSFLLLSDLWQRRE